MMVRRAWQGCLFWAVVIWGTLPLWAGTFSGTLKFANGESRQLVLQASDGRGEVFALDPGVSVTLDGERSSLGALKKGFRVTVRTNNMDQVVSVAATDPDKAKKTPAPAARDKSDDKKKGKKSGLGAGDWPRFGGPDRDNHSHSTGLLPNWGMRGPKLEWTGKGLGAGFSSVAVVNGVIYTMGNQGSSEEILALDAANGKILWHTPIARASRFSGGDGPRGTPAFSDGLVYALGAQGDLACVDAETGKIRWQKNILRDYKARSPTWGIWESVLIDGERLICTPGGDRASMIALDKDSGAVIWTMLVPGEDRAAYASANVAEVGGVRQYVQFMASGTVGVRATDGVFLWRDSSSANTSANFSSPLVLGNMVFSASDFGIGGSLLRLTSAEGRTEAALVYHTEDMRNHRGEMVIVDGLVYGSDDQMLTCLDLQSGRVMWQDRSVGKGAVTYADGHVYLRGERGGIALVEAVGTGYRERGRFEQPRRSQHPAWSFPVVAEGKLFLRDQDVLLCYDLKGP